MEIHCIEQQKKGFEDKSLEEVKEMVGLIEPPDEENGNWDVTMADGSGFECKDQATATILASIEEVKALLMEKIK